MKMKENGMRHGCSHLSWGGSWAVAAVLALLTSTAAVGQDTIVGTPHDLSVTGPGRIHAVEEEQICIFCHAPHHATGQAPLWNRYMPQTHYKIYDSSTTDARIDQPSGPSKMCLSCHDGSLAIGLVASRPPDMPIVMTQRTIPPGPTDLTHDLSDDHPIGFRYDRALAFRDRQLKNPELLTGTLPLGKHGELHCTTCHDPHNNRLGDFLREPRYRSTICLSCHDLKGWDISSHARSNAHISGRAVDPRERLGYPTVAENACENCHKIHGAEQPERLLRYRIDHFNCLNCHNGSVARTNVLSEIRKRSNHPVEKYVGVHDPAEDPRFARRHVQCVDCHNPHAALGGRPSVIGSPSLGVIDETLRFVSGIDRSGLPIEHSRFEYEVCFKCHGDSVHIQAPRIPRQAMQTNTRLEFQPANPSFHPVVAPRNNNDVVSLISPWRVGAMMKCTDCHNTDQADNPFAVKGPHGSIYSPILIDNYQTGRFVTESPQAYALCYRCHSRASILGDQSFPLHNAHVVRGRTPCSACHDAHGISRLQTSGRSDHTNLINFDLSIVQPASGGLGDRIVYQDLGPRRGSCTLTCHGVVHVNFQYGF